MQEINDIVYKQKYLKYKAKYLELQEQIGGDDGGKDGDKLGNTNELLIRKYLLCTHNSRIRCLIKRYFSKSNDINKIKFKNCAIFKLSISLKSDDINLELVYGGEVDEKKLKKHKYFIPEPQNHHENEVQNHHTNEVYFKTVESTKTKLLDNLSITSDIEIYIIRHGEGEHNVGSFIKKHSQQDPSLTIKGINQASIGAKTYINNVLNDTQFNKLFASKLYRTWETLINVLDDNMITYKKIIILPCSHELAYKPGKDGNCDANQRLGGIVPWTSPENIDKCSKNQTKPDCMNITKKDKDKELNYSINWKHYNKFYIDTKGKCRDTNMIKEMINIIKNETENTNN
jgi:broad specificity phosphatase PhoE